jgi:hypothetical protein
LDTLAAAYAEAGQFERAVTTQREAIRLIGKNDDYEKRLKLFEAHQPYRKPQ